MAEASVFIELESEEPTVAPDELLEELEDLLGGGVGVEKLYIVSEYGLRVAVKALQWLALTSRCHNSRVVADDALCAIGAMGDLPSDEDGRPETVLLDGRPEDVLAAKNHYRWLD